MRTPFSLSRALAVARKEAIHVRRDPRSLALAFILPSILMVLFGSALSYDLDRVPFVVLDRDRTVQSRGLTAAFSGSRYFSLLGQVGREKEIDRLVEGRTVLLALVIDKGFGSDVLSGRGADVQILADGSDSLTAQIAMGYCRAVVQGFALSASPHGRTAPLSIRLRVLYNPELKSRIFTVSGLIALIMIIIGAVLTSLTVSREWERGTMEQLITTPVRTSEILLGKFLPYFAIGLIDLTLSIAVAVFVFGVPLHGSLPLLFVLAALFLAVALGQGLLISTVARNQLLANQLALLTSFLPAFLLSGFFAPIVNMPAIIRAITVVIPARYAMTICRGVMLKGVGLGTLWPQAAALAIFCVLIFAVAARRFRRRIA